LPVKETPISYDVDHNTRTVFTKARGVIKIDDFVEHARELANTGLFAYSQLIDAREARLKIAPNDIEILVSQNKELRRVHGNAKTAFVAKHATDFGMMRMYELKIGEHDTGFAVFYEIDHAIEWILP
jgi:hypothetical protein